MTGILSSFVRVGTTGAWLMVISRILVLITRNMTDCLFGIVCSFIRSEALRLGNDECVYQC